MLKHSPKANPHLAQQENSYDATLAEREVVPPLQLALAFLETQLRSGAGCSAIPGAAEPPCAPIRPGLWVVAKARGAAPRWHEDESSGLPQRPDPRDWANSIVRRRLVGPIGTSGTSKGLAGRGRVGRRKRSRRACPPTRRRRPSSRARSRRGDDRIHAEAVAPSVRRDAAWRPREHHTRIDVGGPSWRSRGAVI